MVLPPFHMRDNPEPAAARPMARKRQRGGTPLLQIPRLTPRPGPATLRAMKYLNLALLIAFPIAWFAPLLRAALLPWFGMDEISVISGLQSLWGTDPALALLVTFLAIFAPYAKTLGLALIHWNLLKPSTLPALHVLGKLAMADVFLIALYVVLAKGIGHATIETAWGLYLFTACILASLAISWRTTRQG